MFGVLSKLTKDLELTYLQMRRKMASANSKKYFNAKLNNAELKKRKLKLLSYPVHLQIGTNITCNLKCLFCKYNNPIERVKVDNMKQDEKEMSFSMIDKISDFLPYAQSVLIKNIGEPLLFSKLPELLEQCKKYQADNISLSTNCTMFNKQNAKSIIQGGLNKIFLCLESVDKATYDSLRPPAEFQKFEEGLSLLNYYKKKLEQRLPQLVFIVRLSLRNIKQANQIIDYAASHGIDEVIFQAMETFQESVANESLFSDVMITRKELGIAKAKASAVNMKLTYDMSLQNLLDSEQKPKKVGNKTIIERVTASRNKPLLEKCLRPYNQAFVAVNGDIKPCSCTDIVFGNLRHNSFDEIWNSEEAANIRKMFLGNYIPEGCHEKACNVDV